MSSTASLSDRLGKLDLLLEATSLLHSQLPLDSALCTMIDHAVSVTGADRGLLLEADGSASLRVRLARSSSGDSLPVEILRPSQTALRQALDQRSSVITEDLTLADTNLQAAQSVVAQRLRAVVVIPLYAMPRASSTESLVLQIRPARWAILYLDSRRALRPFPGSIARSSTPSLYTPAASWTMLASSNAKRERQRLHDQELNIARNIQAGIDSPRLP